MRLHPLLRHAGPHRRRGLVLLSGVSIASALVIVACSLPEPLRSVVFEEPAKGKAASPRPVVHNVRHPPPRPAAPAPVEVMLPVPDPTDWRAALNALPHNDDEVDWTRALLDKAIEPKPGIEPAAALADVLDLDVELVPKDQPEQAVAFSHQVHTQWLACANCHPAIFEMQAGADPINMAAIFEGKYCGECHGKVAFAVETGCPRCHRKQS